MKSHNQKGSALIFAMIFILVLSITGVSLMFLSQSETWSTLNYRLMTQARYGAEAGINAAANYLTTSYVVPTTGGADPIAGYNYDVSPVQPAAGGAPIVLGATMNGFAQNYPIANVATAFHSATAGSLAAGNNTINYSVNAVLVSMRQVTQCSTGKKQTAQVWQLTSHGDIGGVRNSEVEVSAILEQQILPCYNYAGFATGNDCGSISFNGGGTIDSYDSAAVNGNSAPTTQSYDGNLGSNGNLNTASNTAVNGTFSSPRTGAGTSCQNGGVEPPLTGNLNAVTGCEDSVQLAANTCSSSVVQLAHTINFPPPTTDYPSCTTNISACDNATATANNLNTPGTNLTVDTTPGVGYGHYGDISASGNTTITLNPTGTDLASCGPAVYYINSISLAGNAQIQPGWCPGTGTNNGNNPKVFMPIIINLVGANGKNPVLDMGGNGFANPGYDPSLIQIQYGGSGGINLHGNGNSAAVLFAPNAGITFSGNANWYGSVIGKTIQSNGNATVSIHYDRRLSQNLFNVGNWTLNSFTWSKF